MHQIALESTTTQKVKIRKVQWCHLTTTDLDWPLEIPNVIGNNEYYLVLHVHIHITRGNADVHKHTSRQTAGGKFHLTWPQLWRHRSRVMWVMGFEICRQDVKMRDKKVYEVQCHSPVNHESYFRKNIWRGVASLPVPARVKFCLLTYDGEATKLPDLRWQIYKYIIYIL